MPSEMRATKNPHEQVINKRYFQFTFRNSVTFASAERLNIKYIIRSFFRKIQVLSSSVDFNQTSHIFLEQHCSEVVVYAKNKLIHSCVCTLKVDCVSAIISKFDIHNQQV